MFGNLRKKLNSAIQEGLTISGHHANSNINASQGSSIPGKFSGPLSNFSASNTDIPNDVNIAAGCNLLDYYERSWKALHDANEDNMRKAASVAEQIDSIGQRTEIQRTIISDLCSCLASVPALVETLKASQSTLEQVQALTSEVEEELECLENLCEECELQEFMLLKQCELSQLQQKKMMELENYRQRVAATHQDKIRQHEQRLRQIQRERQAVFDHAFREDLEEYKQKGSIARIQTPADKSMPLEEVVLEDSETKDALEEFLNA